MQNNSRSISISSCLYWAFAALFIANAIGWCANVYKLIMMLDDLNISAMLIARIAGLVIAPLGGLMGYF